MPTRPILIAGNWKMNLGPKATREFALTIRPLLSAASDVSHALSKNGSALKSLVFVSDVSLSTAKEAFAGTGIQIGAQNVHWEDQGAFTGEISAPMIQELGIGWTLVGHSERRQYFGETDQTVKKRTEAHLKHGLQVVLCIGETKAERETNNTEAVLKRQLENGLPDLAALTLKQPIYQCLFIAYEPVWAIGTGLTATPEQAEEAHTFTRMFLAKHYGEDIASKMLILYGGSVTPENIQSLLAQPNVDGGLVGGASIKPASYLSLLQAGAKAISATLQP
jgi:triosephosphate isomerase